MVLRSCKALGSYDPLIELRNKMEVDVRAIIKQAIQLTYFMRGSISYDEILIRTPAEKQIISEFINERLEAQQKLQPVQVY